MYKLRGFPFEPLDDPVIEPLGGPGPGPGNPT